MDFHDDEEKRKHHELATKLLAEQNFSAAVVAGAIAMVLAAAGYGIIVARWPFSNGFAAAGVGMVIGFFMGFLGRGIETRFAVVAVLYTVAGCVLGNIFMIVVVHAVGDSISPIDVLRNNTLSALAEQSFSYFSLIHLVYWFVAAFCAAFLARRSLTRQESLALGRFEMGR